MEPKLTDRSKRVLTLAGEIAAEWGHHFVGTEHLLLALVRENQGVAATVLRNLGAIDRIMPEVTKLMESVKHVSTEPTR